jgi:excisionase family DNA binding protein
MAHPTYLRDKARSLRERHKLTIDELAERLALSRSTIYYWVRDMPIPGSGRGGGWPESAHRNAARATRRKHRLLREAAYREGVDSFDRLALDRGFRDFVCLYIAEGSKRKRHAAELCNSDAAVMKLATQWMRRLASGRPTFWIQFHADQDLSELRAFWAAALEVAPDAIRFQRKSNSGKMKGRHWRSRYGVLSVRVNDTYFRARLQAWMDRVRVEWRHPAD